MRKILTLILAAIMVASASTFAAYAQSTETSAAITAAYGTPVIDGVQDDIWSTTEVQDVKLVDKNVIPSDTKTTGTVRVLWDNDFLYFFISVDKHGVKISSGGGNGENTDDCADVCFSMTGNFTGSNNVPTGGDADCGVFRTLLDGTFGGFGEYQVAHLSDFKGAMKQTSDSTYNSEYAIPWEDITPKADYVMGMEIQINDATNGARTGLVNWAYVPCYGWRDSMYHGMVTLLAQAAQTEAPAAETAAPAAEAPATTDTSASASAPATGDAAVIAVAVLGTCCAAAYVWSRKRH